MGGGIVLFVKKCIEHEKPSLKNSHKQVLATVLWVRIRDRGNKENLVEEV